MDTLGTLARRCELMLELGAAWERRHSTGASQQPRSNAFERTGTHVDFVVAAPIFIGDQHDHGDRLGFSVNTLSLGGPAGHCCYLFNTRQLEEKDLVRKHKIYAYKKTRSRNSI